MRVVGGVGAAAVLLAALLPAAARHTHHASRFWRCSGNATCEHEAFARRLLHAGNTTAERTRRSSGDRFTWGWRALCLRPADGGHCPHKPLLPHVVPLEAVAALLFFAVAALAQAAGVGGGGIFVPCLNLLLRFSPHVSVGLSQALICGGALGALLVNTRERHPTADRPLIDFALAAFLAPAEMAGAQLGVLVNQSLPSLLILVSMAALLGVLALRTLRKGRAAWVKERAMARRFEETAEEGLPSPTPWAPLVAREASESDSPRRVAEVAAEAAEVTSAASSQSASPRTPWPIAWCDSVLSPAEPSADAAVPTARALAVAARTAAPSDLGLLLGVWLGLMGLLLLRGGKGVPSVLGLSRCGAGYWAITALELLIIITELLIIIRYWAITALGILWLLGVSLLAGRRLVMRERLQRRAGSEYAAAGDVRWDGPRAARCLRGALGAGVVAGSMGVGGGLVLGPLMLELSMLPEVSAATTSTMVLLTSSSAASVFLLGGVAPADYALALGAITMLGGVAGRSGVAFLVRRYASARTLLRDPTLVGPAAPGS